MTIWFLTIGNSDILLNSSKNWELLRRKLQNNDLTLFKPTPFADRIQYTVPARSLGLVYGDHLEAYGRDLLFPRLDTLYQAFEQTGVSPRLVVLLLTDQSTLFSPADLRLKACPYWQDTCTLRSILSFYFKQRLPDAQLSDWLLQPEPGQPGLDHWESTLSLMQALMQARLSELQLDDQETVYLSHQAGTPALSSAIQFVCLTQFGPQVKFLVSNEYQGRSYESIDSSVYLRSLRLQSAKALLDRYDYFGVKSLLATDLDPETHLLLDAAIQWNFAEFVQFAQLLERSTDSELVALVTERSRADNWWWTAYEAAYLAKIRLAQVDIVEAMFHSFRALEGLAIKFAKTQNKQGVYGRKAFSYLKHHKAKAWNTHRLNHLIRFDSDDPQTRDDILDRRNTLFHQLSGLTQQDFFVAWQTNEPEWETVILSCLNFISGQMAIVSLDEFSLMAQVHERLRKAIADKQV